MKAESQAIANCARCGVRCCKQSGNDEARLLQYTTSDFGLCVNCGVTEFLQSLDVIRTPGRGAAPFDPQSLRLEHVQRQFTAIMSAGKADARPNEIDWLEVIANWSLPFPRRPSRKRKERHDG